MGLLFCQMIWTIPALSAAPEESSPKEKAVDLGEIRVIDQVSPGMSPEDVSAFTSVIYPEKYQGEFQTTAELLERTVGVRVIDFGGLGQHQAISIRGSSPEQIVVLLDGVRLNSAQRGGVDISSIPLEMIERIEVIRGGEAALFGTDALGGVVNIISKKGKTGEDGKPATSLLGSLGSFHTFKGSFSHGFKVEDFDYFISHTHQSTRGNFSYLNTNFQEAVRINNKSLSEASFVRLGYDAEGIGRFEVSDQFFWTERGQPGFGLNQLFSAESEEFRNLFSVQFLRKNLKWDGFDIRIQGFHRVEDFEFRDLFPLMGAAVVSDTRNHGYGGKIHLDYFLPPWQLLSLIMELRNETADVFSNSSGALVFQNFSVDRFTYSFVLKDEFQVWEDRIAILPTLRWEQSTSTRGEIVPKLGARFRPVKWFQLKGNIGRVFRIPNFDELYFPESELIGGNPALIPEEGFSSDLGFDITHKQMFFSVAAFYSEMENAIFFVPISATRIMPLNFQDHTINQGFEIEAEWNPIKYFSINANYTFLDHYFQSTRFRLPGRSVHDAHFRIVLKYPPWVKVYVEGQYLSKFALVLSASGGQLEPERFVLNTGVSVSPWEFLTVSFDAKDVNNERGINDSRDFPLPERRYFGTVNVKF